MNKVNRCIIFFLQNINDLNNFNVAPDIYTDVEIDEILLPVLKKISTPARIRTISFSEGKFSTLISNGSGGRIMVLPLSILAKKKITLLADSKNLGTFEFLKNIFNINPEIPAIIYFPD
jgi:hypothetical protein